MKKLIIILVLLCAQVTLYASSLEDYQAVFYPSHSNTYKRLVMAHALSQMQRGDGWDIFDWSRLELFELFDKPLDPFNYLFLPIFGNLELSEWGKWDGWLKHNTLKRSGDEVDSNTYVLNNQGYLKEYIRYYDYTGITGHSKKIFNHNSQGELVEKRFAYWSENTESWDTTTKLIYHYNSTGDVINDSTYVWEDSNATWIVSQKSRYVHIPTENRTEIVTQFKFQDIWYDYYTRILTYDGNENLIEWVWHDWDHHLKSSFSYDSNNIISESINYSYNEEDSSWTFSSKEIYKFSDTDTTIRISQKWDTINNEWINVDSSKSLTYLDSIGNLIESIGLAWSEDKHAWVKSGKSVYTYNSRGNPDEYVYYNWDTTLSDWVLNNDLYFKVTYDYTKISYPKHSHVSNKPDIQIVNSNRTVRISIPQPTAKNNLMKVYDLRGRLVKTIKPERHCNTTVYNWRFSGAHRLYVLTLMHNGLLFRKKIVVAQ